ncbi:MAG: hypothetical protein LBD81_02875 [Holosporaceae bacterium]|jgi:hypothetical protein|nr:hypothetical protein [Holosporaceae bacterium]
MKKLALYSAIICLLGSFFKVAADKTTYVDLSLTVVPEFELNVSPSSDKIEMVVHQDGTGKYPKANVIWKNSVTSVSAPQNVIPIDFTVWTTLPAGTSMKVSGTEYSNSGDEFRLVNKGKDGLTPWTGESSGPEHISFKLKKLTEGSGNVASIYVSNGGVLTSPTVNGSENATTAQEISIGEHISFGIEFIGDGDGLEYLASSDLIPGTVYRERLTFTFVGPDSVE